MDQLSQKLENASEEIQDSQDDIEALLEHFLQNGHFPWWAQETSIAALEEKILTEKQIAFSLSTILKNDPEKLKRLVFQFSDKLLQTLLDQHFGIAGTLNGFRQELQEILSKSFPKTEVRNQLWLFVFEALIFNNQAVEQAKIYIFKSSIEHFSEYKNPFQSKAVSKTQLAEKVLKTQLAEAVLKKLKNIDNALATKLQAAIQSINSDNKSLVLKAKEGSKTDKKTKTDIKPDQKSWYINNAGLVLLNPFFVLFFEELGLTKKNVFKDFHSKNQAALLLQYLSDGKTQSFENELVLNKILCEIPLSMPIEKDLILNEKIKTESENLLNAVIKHWSPLKNTSPDSLRNTFLQREGKLVKNENGGWKLIIQHQTFDILISKLPWTISIIKLPWMKNMLQVEWA